MIRGISDAIKLDSNFSYGIEEVGITFGIACAQLRARREITLPMKVRLVKARISLVVMYDCERWTIKKVESESDVAQSCLTLCDPMECSLPVSSVHGIFQTRILQWVAISFSSDLPNPGIELWSPALQADSLPSEPPGKPPKKAEHQRINAFELWCWRRLLTVPFTTRRSNQSILREINPEYSFEGLMQKLKLQHFGHVL